MVRSLAAAAVLAAACALATSPGRSAAAAARPQLGIDTYFPYRCQSLSTLERWATTQFRAFHGLGANATGITFPIYTSSLTANSVFSRTNCRRSSIYSTPTNAALGAVVRVAHKFGLKVFLRPSIDQTDLVRQGSGAWHGLLKPTNRTLWFKNYLGTLRPFLQLSQALHVEHFAIESELNSLTLASNWKSLIAQAKRWYHGDVVWNYSWLTTVKKITRAGTSFGVDTYPALWLLSPAATPAEIEASWNTLLGWKDFTIPNVSSATIDEVGILAQDGAYAAPYDVSFPMATHPFDQSIQVNWFTAACLFMKDHAMHGIYFWGPWLTQRKGVLLSKPNPGDTGDLQPLGQHAIKACFAG
jgi:hypothetical protein